MDQTVHLLFLGARSGCRSHMAEGFAKGLAPAEVVVSGADIEPRKVHPGTVQVMREVGIEITEERDGGLADLETSAVDVVICLTEGATVACSILPGAPAVVRWEIEDPLASDSEPSLDKFRQVRDEIRRRVEDFFSGGYLPTLTRLKHNSEVLLDHLSDGIIAHDSNQIITWFNRAAEGITGYDRQEVLGHKCTDVFEGGFCGGKCLFSDGPRVFDDVQYPLKIKAKDGTERRVEMTVVGMKNDRGEFEGVLARFHDVTEVTQLRQKLRTSQSFHGIIGGDEKMQELYDLIADLAQSDCAVLIQGESGTGKELVAGAIHGESSRAGGPMVTVNCGALPEGILESELFGHVRGAFTGAVRDKKGRFELADGGTIFLDEVGELSTSMQVKLLRVLQEGSFEPVGGEKTVKVDVRVLSATNRDIKALVQTGEFREDLYYRLAVVPLSLPALRERRNDIPLLLKHFVKRFAEEMNRPIGGTTPEAVHCALDYSWPGNIRELQNAIQYAFVKCKKGIIDRQHFPPEIRSYNPGRQRGPREPRCKLEAASVTKALEKAGGNRVQAAQELGVGRATLYRFMKRHEMV